MTQIQLGAVSAALGAFCAFILFFVGAVTPGWVASFSPFNRQGADSTEITDNINAMTEAGLLSRGEGSVSPGEARPVELISLWRAGERAGVLVKGSDGQTRQLRIGESIGRSQLMSVENRQAIFAHPDGRIALHLHDDTPQAGR